ncbi:MAG: acyl-CoA dehydrogenase family protein [Actinomycetota bacterium]|nr:acyl-CoA dehydrogenase family protein [Actinomycetota bacterium]
MGFDEAAFTTRCEAWFVAHCEPLDPERHDPPGLIPYTTVDHDAPLRAARAHQRGLWAAGLAGLCMPREFGGQGLPPAADAAFNRVAAGYAVPSMIPLSVGLSLAAPTIAEFGSDAMRTEHIPRIFAADDVWCQLFSEPDAGSDLASLRAAADRVAGGYVVTGQKVWTSFAQHSAYGLLLARTTRSEAKHRGLSLFAVPMHLPGMRIRPLKEMTGGTHFNEVFFDDVFVPEECLLGAEGEGWTVAMFTLGNERNLTMQRTRPKWKRLAELARRSGVAADPVVRARLTDIAMREEMQRWNAMRSPAVPASMGKLMGAQLEQLASTTAADLLGAAAMAHEVGDTATEAAVHWFLGARANSIAGGTDEVQRNILAERVLGLPRMG